MYICYRFSFETLKRVLNPRDRPLLGVMRTCLPLGHNFTLKCIGGEGGSSVSISHSSAVDREPTLLKENVLVITHILLL
jgi:hypothetical protein